jgi:hypothetical protein
MWAVGIAIGNTWGRLGPRCPGCYDGGTWREVILMPYGINFGLPPVPKGLFVERIKRPDGTKGWLWLQGIADNSSQCDMMCVQAQNGNRMIHTVNRGSRWAIYVGGK